MKEEDMPCPEYAFLKKAEDGKWQLEIPQEYLSQFIPVTKATYDRWLEEKLANPTEQDLEDMKGYEMEA